MINELNINSVIATPGHDEVLPINALTTQKPYTMKGYAYSGESPFLQTASRHHVLQF
jgi:nitrate reductase (NAD(P)H)